MTYKVIKNDIHKTTQFMGRNLWRHNQSIYGLQFCIGLWVDFLYVCATHMQLAYQATDTLATTKDSEGGAHQRSLGRAN